jgi:hypothetical protein
MTMHAISQLHTIVQKFDPDELWRAQRLSLFGQQMRKTWDKLLEYATTHLYEQGQTNPHILEQEAEAWATKWFDKALAHVENYDHMKPEEIQQLAKERGITRTGQKHDTLEGDIVQEMQEADQFIKDLMEEDEGEINGVNYKIEVFEQAAKAGIGMFVGGMGEVLNGPKAVTRYTWTLANYLHELNPSLLADPKTPQGKEEFVKALQDHKYDYRDILLGYRQFEESLGRVRPPKPKTVPVDTTQPPPGAEPLLRPQAARQEPGVAPIEQVLADPVKHIDAITQWPKMTYFQHRNVVYPKIQQLANNIKELEMDQNHERRLNGGQPITVIPPEWTLAMKKWNDYMRPGAVPKEWSEMAGTFAIPGCKDRGNPDFQIWGAMSDLKCKKRKKK